MAQSRKRERRLKITFVLFFVHLHIFRQFLAEKLTCLAVDVVKVFGRNPDFLKIKKINKVCCDD